MDHKDLCEHTRIRLIAAAVGHQQCTKTAACIVPIPGGDRVIAIGAPAEVRALLTCKASGSDGTAAAGAPKLLGQVVMYPNYSTVIQWVEGVTPPSGTKLYSIPGHVAATCQPLADEQIVGVLHSLGVDTYPSKYGFTELQVSATSLPTIRKVVEMCAALAHQSPSIDQQGEPVAEVEEGDDGLFISFIYGPDGSQLKRGDKLYAAPSLSAKDDQDAKDAARYRWLRNEHIEGVYVWDDRGEMCQECGDYIMGEDLDVAIDAAIAASRQENVS